MSTGKAQYPGAGLICSVAVTAAGIKDPNGFPDEQPYKLDSINFTAISSTNQEITAATVDNNISEQLIPVGQTIRGYMNFDVPKGNTIKSVELLDAGLQTATTWSY